VYGHHPFFLGRKRWIKPRINKEKKNEETPLEPKPKSKLQFCFSRIGPKLEQGSIIL